MEDVSTPQPAAAVPGPMAGLAITGIVVVLVVAWILIGLQFLHDTSLVGGFMLLWYWANNEALDLGRLPATLLGAVTGIGIAWFLVYGATQWGAPGLGAALAVLILALYLDVTKAVPLVVNAATMLFVTLAAAPLIQLHVDWIELVLSTVVGGLFFAVAVEAVKRIAARFGSG